MVRDKATAAGLALAVAAWCWAGQAEEHAAPYHAGLRILDLRFARPDGTSEPLTLAVWYPTDAAERPFAYGAERPYASRVAVEAAPARQAAPCPLVVFAHGLYGSGYNAAYFLEHLARHGTVAAAADYVDMAPPAYTRPLAFSRIRGGGGGRPGLVVLAAGRFVRDHGDDEEPLLRYLAERRLPQTSFVIDTLIAQGRDAGSPLHGLVNEEAIGLCGHSLGGLTILGKTAAHPAAAMRDARVRAVLVLSAPGFPFHKSADRIGLPLMLMGGDHDPPGLHPAVPRRAVFDRARPPRYYLVVRDATHFTFGCRGCGGVPLHRAVRDVPQTRVICRYGLDFFEAWLRGDRAAAERLTQMDPALAYLAGEAEAGAAFEHGREPPAGAGGPGGIRREILREWLRRRPATRDP